MLKEYLSNLANAFRTVLGTTEKINAQDFSSKVNEVYEKGKAEGNNYNLGYTEGKEAGKKEQDKAFWNLYTSNGNQNVCDYMFAGKCWKNTVFNLPYSLKPIRCISMFALTGMSGNLREILDNLGITFDFSNCTLFDNMFTNASAFTETPPIDISKATSTSGMFVNAFDLVTIGTLTCSETTVLAVGMFDNTNDLENITFAGVIPTSLRFRNSSKLTDASVDNIVATLKDYSGTTTSPTLTVHADVYNRMAELGKDVIVTSKNWKLAKA